MTSTQPALLGAEPTFPTGLPLVRPAVGDVAPLLVRLEAILRSGRLTNGPVVRELEETVAEQLGVPHVVGVASCTAGLMLVLQGLGVSGRVVMPAFTFSASAHAVRWAGGTPVWADVSADSLTLDPEHAAARLDGASAMTATHVYGTPCRVEALQQVADDAGVPLVYDSAHALGSRRGDRPVGGFGAAEVFSLSPTKVAVGGEGGLVATHDSALAEHVRIGRDYGNPGDYDCLFAGLNARMSELHAAVALSSLEALPERVARRNELVDAFRAATDGVPGLRLPTVDEGDLSTWKDLTLILDPETFGLSAPALGQALAREGVESRRYYYPSIDRQKAYADLPPAGALPVTYLLAPQVLTLALPSDASDRAVADLAGCVIALHTRAEDVRAALL